jgi:hypothetical protein
VSADLSYAIFHSLLSVPDIEGALGIAASSTNTYYSDNIACNGADVIGVHLESTGTLTGTYTLWVSSVPRPNIATDADWVQDTVPTFVNPAAGVSKQHLHLGNLGARWARIKYVNASGTGNLKGWACAKRDG